MSVALWKWDTIAPKAKELMEKYESAREECGKVRVTFGQGKYEG